MGATTNTGRTRSRRAQALNSIINGQASTLFFYGATAVGAGQIDVGCYDLDLNAYVNMASPIGATIKIVLLNGTGSHPQTVPVTITSNFVQFTTSPAAVAFDNLMILPWQEGVRGQNGEWFNGAILDVA